MSKSNILEILKEKILICDGAMGTMLYSKAISPMHCYEYLNIEKPKLIEELHREYILAGANIIETNTFGANFTKLAKYNLEKEVRKINFEAVKIAQQAAQGKDIFIAGSIGPLSKIAPEHNFSDHQIYDIYKEQVLVLADAGVDFFILETFSNLEQIKVALSACKNETSLPVIAQMTFLDGLRTSFGDNSSTIVKVLTEGKADVLGANCGNGPANIFEVISNLAGLTDKFISAQPNAGYPQVVDGRTMFLSSPEYFANYSANLVQAGANIVGGCCGTTPEHIRLIAEVLKNAKPVLRQKQEVQIPVAYIREEKFFQKKDKKKTNVIVELLPPKNADTQKLLDTALMLKANGAKVLSFPENPLAQVRMSSIASSGLVREKTGLETIFHYTCRDRNLIGLQSDLLGAYALGLRNILAVTGDPASLGSNPEASSVFDVNSIKLVKLIDNMKKSLSLDISIGVALNPNFENISSQVERLKRKIEAGAQFVMTQPMFDPEKVLQMHEKTKNLGVPIFVGVLPLVSKRNAEFLHNEVPGMQIPLEIRKRMEIEDKNKAQEEGIKITLDLIQATKDFVSGFYLISPLHKYEISAKILGQV